MNVRGNDSAAGYHGASGHRHPQKETHMKRYALLAAAGGLIGLAVMSRGQSDPPAPAPDASQPPAVTAAQFVSPAPAPATVLESQSLAKGMLIVKGYTDVATLAGDDDSSVRTTAVEVAQPSEKFRGIIFTIHQGGRAGAREAVAYLDEDEIKPLGEALDAMSRLERGASPMNDFEGCYRTRGNLEITNYNRGGARMVSLRAVQVLLPSGEITWATARFSVARLTELRQQLTTAAQTLDRARSAATEGPNDHNK
jgi:hypothetical protein